MDLHLQDMTWILRLCPFSASGHRKGEALGSYPRGVQRREDDIHESTRWHPKGFRYSSLTPVISILIRDQLLLAGLLRPAEAKPRVPRPL
jgi:hypothetical protein